MLAIFPLCLLEVKPSIGIVQLNIWVFTVSGKHLRIDFDVVKREFYSACITVCLVIAIVAMSSD